VDGEVRGVLRVARGALVDAAPARSSDAAAADLLRHQQVAGRCRHLVAVARLVRVAVVVRSRQRVDVDRSKPTRRTPRTMQSDRPRRVRPQSK